MAGGELSVYLGGEVNPLGSAVDFVISPSGHKIAVIDGNRGLYVYDPNTEREAERKFAGLGESVENIIWYKDEAHLFVLEGGGLYFRDIAKGSPVSSFELAEGVSKLVYRQGEDKIYISKQSGIWEIGLSI